MKRVAIICGGFSSEYEISVLSAQTIQSSLPEHFEAYLVHMNKEGWKVTLENSFVPFDENSFSFEKDGELLGLDFAIVYIHGDPGENGKIQAFLEMKGIPFVNSGPLASELSFDKWYCNQFLRAFDVSVAKSVYLRKTDSKRSAIDELGLPIFVKPCDSGSSYGISKVERKEDLDSAIEAAFVEGDTVIVEENLDGIEVTCGVYRSVDGIKTLPLTEIVTGNSFFDYEAKYNGESEEITPARIDLDITKEIQELSIRIYQLMNLRSIARIDYMIVNGTPYVIEVNTTPGFSAESIVPKMIEAQGISIREFWAEILEAELD